MSRLHERKVLQHFGWLFRPRVCVTCDLAFLQYFSPTPCSSWFTIMRVTLFYRLFLHQTHLAYKMLPRIWRVAFYFHNKPVICVVHYSKLFWYSILFILWLDMCLRFYSIYTFLLHVICFQRSMFVVLGEHYSIRTLYGDDLYTIWWLYLFWRDTTVSSTLCVTIVCYNYTKFINLFLRNCLLIRPYFLKISCSNYEGNNIAIGFCKHLSAV